MKDVWTEQADILLISVKNEMKTDSDNAALDYIAASTAESLAKVDDRLAALSNNEMHSVIATLLASKSDGDGIELKGGEFGTVPVWIAGTLAQAGYTPSKDAHQKRWIRLDTIKAVFASRTVGVSDDPQDWHYALTVNADGREYHVSPKQFRGSAAQDAVDKVLHAVARLVTL